VHQTFMLKSHRQQDLGKGVCCFVAMQSKDGACSVGEMLQERTVKVILNTFHQRWEIEPDVLASLSCCVTVSVDPGDC
jgi:hypothetical protein